MSRRRGHRLSPATRAKIALALRGNKNARKNSDVGARHQSRLDQVTRARFSHDSAAKRARNARGPSAAQSAEKARKRHAAELEKQRAVAKALRLRIERPKRERAARARIEIKKNDAYHASIQIAPSKLASAGATKKPSGSFASKAKKTPFQPHTLPAASRANFQKGADRRMERLANTPQSRRPTGSFSAGRANRHKVYQAVKPPEGQAIASYVRASGALKSNARPSGSFASKAQPTPGAPKPRQLTDAQKAAKAARARARRAKKSG